MIKNIIKLVNEQDRLSERENKHKLYQKRTRKREKDN